MKNTKHIFYFIIFIVPNIILGQNDSYSDYQFFPLEVGNEWIYENFDYYVDTSDTYLVSFKVVNDTVMPNGKTYYEFFNYFNNGSSIFFRADKINEKVYIYNDLFPDSEFLIYDFNPYQQTYIVNGTDVHVSIGVDLVGKLTIYKSYYQFYFNGPVVEEVLISKDVGISMWRQMEFAGTIGKLVSAKVNGKTFGQLTNIEIQSDNSKKEFELCNFPNPFNSQTKIIYNIPDAGNIELSIINSIGEIIVHQIKYHNSSGEYNYLLNMNSQSSGVYFAKLIYNGKSKHIKLLNVK